MQNCIRSALQHDTIANFDELVDEEEVIRKLFDSIASKKGGCITDQDVGEAIQKLPRCQDVRLERGSLENVLDEVKSKCTGDGLDYNTFRSVVNCYPRIQAQRIQWARNLKMENKLARRLPPGDLFNGLSEVRALQEEKLRRILNEFSKM